MKLIEALEKGQMEEFGTPDKVIETAISKLFFFGDKVVKVYKHGKYFFANLDDLEPRRKFFQDDFFWNHTSSPEIYKELSGVRNGTFEKVSVSEGDDFIILMNKIDGSATFTKLLAENKLSLEDTRQMSIELIELLRVLTDKKLKDFRHLTGMGWRQLWKEDTTDSLRPWLDMVNEHIPKAEAGRVMNTLEDASVKEKYFTNYDENLFAVVIDNNCDNLLFLDGKPSFIDIMPPKEGWRIADEFSTVVRTAVDAYVIGGSKHGNAVYETYRKYRADAPENVKLIYEVRAALIQWPYRHMLGQHDLAEKFKDYVLPKIEQLKTLHS